MLVLPIKATTRCELHTQLAKWLDNSASSSSRRHNYSNGSSPDDYFSSPPRPRFQSVHCRKDLIRLASIRNCIADSCCKSNSHKLAIEEHALRDLHEYHACLLEFEKRGFPTQEEDDDNEKGPIALKWIGAFANQQNETHSSLIWDRICTLWNIAALETFLCREQEEEILASESASKKMGYKICIQHCQTAANIIAILKELFESEMAKNNGNNPYETVDISKPMLNFWESYLKAQAQTFIYHMVASDNADNSKHGMLSYLVMASVNYFNTALTYAQDPRLQSEVPAMAETWGTFCKANSMMCSAKAEYHQAISDRLKKEWGFEIRRLRRSFEKLNATKDFLLSHTDPQTAFVKKEVDVLIHFISDRKIRAENENTRIYQEDIPTDQQLTDIPPKQMVKTSIELPQSMLQTTVPLFVNL